MSGFSGMLASAGKAAASPLTAVFEAFESAGRALDAAAGRGRIAAAALVIPRKVLLVAEMEFLAAAAPVLFLTGRFSPFHAFGAFRTLKARLISWISIVAIASAVVIAFVPNPVMEGYLTQLKDNVRGTSSDLIVETHREFAPERLLDLVTGRTASGGAGRQLLPHPAITANVAAAAPRIEGFVVFSTGDSVDNLDFASIIGIDPEAEYRVSRLRQYILDAGCDPESPFALTDASFEAVLRGESALLSLGREALEALPEAERWRQLSRAAEEEGRYDCVPDSGVPRLVDEYIETFGAGIDRAKAEEAVMRSVLESRAAAEASLARRLGLQKRRAMGTGEFEKLAASSDALAVGPDRAKALRDRMGGRPGVLVGKSLLAENPDLMIGSEIEFITGSLDPEDDPGAAGEKRIGGKNIICRIAGAYDSGMYEFDVRTAFMRLDDAMEFFRDAGAVRGAGIRLYDPAMADAVKPLIQDAIDPGMLNEIAVSVWHEKKQVIIQAVNLQRQVLLVILFFAVFVAGFGILLSLRILVTEKEMDIGILMGIGASPLDVVLFYVIAGLGLGAIGSAAGVVLGAVLLSFADEIVWFFSNVLGFAEFEMYIRETQHLRGVPVRFDAGTLAMIVMLTVLASYQFALYPALAASRLTPLDAIRRK